MWELKVKITVSEWVEETQEWKEEVAATPKIKIDHTATDEAGEYLPDDEITNEAVAKAVEEWKQQTGLEDTEEMIIGWDYSPEKAKKSR